MKKLHLLFLISFFLFPLSYSQNHEVKVYDDTIQARLNSIEQDTAKIAYLNNLSVSFWRKNKLNEAIKYANQAKLLGNHVGYMEGVSFAYNNIGIIYYLQGNYQNALENIDNALAINERINNKNSLASNYNNKGIVYRAKGDYPNALNSYLKALSIYKEINNLQNIASSYNNIGIVQREQGNLEKAIEYYSEAIEIYKETGDQSGYAKALNNISNIYRKQGKYELAIEHNTKALEINKKQKDTLSIAHNYNNIGTIYKDLKNYEESLNYFQKSLQLNKSINMIRNMANDYGNIGELYSERGLYTIAKTYLDSALSISKNIGAISISADVYKSLYTLDSASNNYPGAFENYKNYIFYKDSLHNEENTKQIVQAQMRFEFEQQQIEERAEQERKEALAQEEKRRVAIIRNVFIAGFLITLGLVFYIFRNLKKQKVVNRIINEQKRDVEEKNILIAQQKDLVEAKNKDITDSIQYASKIQQTLLSYEELRKQYFQDSFLFFQPRDIVSGDFYWMYKEGDIIFFACCDCTGHGVPGAFMSLLMRSFLNEAVIEKKVQEPHKILNIVRENIITALNPEGNPTGRKDGMDAVFCAYNNQTKEIKVACANNPFWLIRDGELIEIKPDKMPVGEYYEKDAPSFTPHLIQLQEGDGIYLFTDGYADQFGGEKGKKFKYQRLRTLFLEHAQLPMEEQGRIAQQTFTEWKGKEVQVDDICTMGIRI